MPQFTRRTLVLVTASLVLLVAVVATDRVLAAVAADRLADRLRCLAGLTQPPDVTVRGGPFIPQTLRGRYGHIDVTATGLSRGDVRLSAVRATLRDISTAGGAVSVGAASIEAVVGFDTLPPELAGRAVTYGAADGLLAITTAAGIAGRQLPVTLLGRPAISDGALLIEPREVEVFGIRRPAQGLLDRLDAGSVTRKLPELPAGLTYRGVTVDAEGLAITVTGTATFPTRSATPATPCGADL